MIDIEFRCPKCKAPNMTSCDIYEEGDIFECEDCKTEIQLFNVFLTGSEKIYKKRTNNGTYRTH